jgi:hypothetical protein
MWVALDRHMSAAFAGRCTRQRVPGRAGVDQSELPPAVIPAATIAAELVGVDHVGQDRELCERSGVTANTRSAV